MKDNNMERILFVTAFPPSENAAAEKNTMLMLNDLGKKYEVDLLYFKDADKKEYEPSLETINILRVVPNSRKFKIVNSLRHPFIHPIFTVRFNKELLVYLQNKIEDNHYKALIFDHSQSLYYAKKLKFHGPKLLICHDVEAQRFERTSTRIMSRLCRFSENAILHSDNATVFTFCQKDSDLIYEYYQVKAKVIFDYIDEKISDSNPSSISEDYVMFGNWARKDNYEGAVWLLNSLDEHLEDAVVVNIIGKKFPIEKIDQPLKKIKINLLGFVDNPYPIISKSKAMLCPLLTGAGIKVKVIESLACGTPVIGTEIAFEGFSEKYQPFMFLCHSQSDFAKMINSISFTIEERKAFKNMFINDYTSATIPQWVDRLNNTQNIEGL